MGSTRDLTATSNGWKRSGMCPAVPGRWHAASPPPNPCSAGCTSWRAGPGPRRKGGPTLGDQPPPHSADAPRNMMPPCSPPNRHRRDRKPDARTLHAGLSPAHDRHQESETLGINIEHVEWIAPTGRSSLSNMPARPTVTRKESCRSARGTGFPPTRKYLVPVFADRETLPWSPRRLEYLLEDIGNEAG